MLPESSDLEPLAVELIVSAVALGERLHPITRDTVVEMLRTINSYYSNLVEGHATHPFDIERAMKGDYAKEPAKRALQIEARAHIEVDRLIDGRLRGEEDLNVCSREFLCWVHEEFYSRMPSEYRTMIDPATQEILEIVPGRLRDRDVVAGRHLAPSYRELPHFHERFADVYDPSSPSNMTRRILSYAASHHRLLWIHPFLDGNGRVARLFTNAYAQRVGIAGHGLWTASRGLARNKTAYMNALLAADAERRNDYDGRGHLSQTGLVEFSRFFLTTCLDQIRFMSSILELRDLGERVAGYVVLRSNRMVVGRDELRPEAAHLLVEALHHGEVDRGDAARVTGLGTRTARALVRQLTEEGLLHSLTSRGPLRLGLPIQVVSYYFPQLYPEDATPIDLPA